MRILLIDCDSLRPDHIGAYGYHRDTTPNIDDIAERGQRFDRYYVSDAPCLPSRTAYFTGRFGFHTGVVDHGGLNADPRPIGPDRDFRNHGPYRTIVESLRQADHRTALVSPFPSRHAAWHVLDGFQDWRDTGGYGLERADTVVAEANEWLAEHASEEDWYLHVNFWDPHCPYDTPAEFGNPFADEPGPNWLTDDLIADHREGYGFISARDTIWFAESRNTTWTPDEIVDREDFEQWIDGYDIGIRYMDSYIGSLIDSLDRKGVLEETLIVVTADHGENQGELNVYGDHETADEWTCRVPLIVAGPSVSEGVDEAFRYQLDLGPTLVDLADAEPAPGWDGRSFAAALEDGDAAGREYLVLSQGAWACQRAVRWQDWLCIRTYHDGVKQLDPVMLFDLEEDPHETENLAESRPDVVGEAMRRLEDWRTARLTNAALGDAGGIPEAPNALRDPLWNVVRAGGPYHSNRSGGLAEYVQRLRDTGRTEHADTVERVHLQGEGAVAPDQGRIGKQ